MSAAKLSVYGDWLVQEASGCTCQGSDAHYGHQPGCGYEPLVKLDEIKVAFRAAGHVVVELPRGSVDSAVWANQAGGVTLRHDTDGLVSNFTAARARRVAASLLAAADAAERAE